MTEERFERLEGIVDALAISVVAHDHQIDALIRAAEKHEAARAETDKQIKALAEQIANSERLWQAYLRRLPPQ